MRMMRSRNPFSFIGDRLSRAFLFSDAVIPVGSKTLLESSLNRPMTSEIAVDRTGGELIS
jgi:hypothetical protein